MQSASWRPAASARASTCTLCTLRNLQEQRGIRCYVEGTIQDWPGEGGSNGSSSGGYGGFAAQQGAYANCSALLINIRDWLQRLG